MGGIPTDFGFLTNDTSFCKELRIAITQHTYKNKYTVLLVSLMYSIGKCLSRSMPPDNSVMRPDSTLYAGRKKSTRTYLALFQEL